VNALNWLVRPEGTPSLTLPASETKATR
jgi:hypothetical protein